MTESSENTSSFKSIGENRFIQYTLACIVGLLIVNAIVIDVLFFTSKQNAVQNTKKQEQVAGVCPQGCFEQLAKVTQSPINSSNSAAASTAAQASPTPSPTPTPTPIPIPTTTPTPTNTLHEYFIPLGSGNGSATDWTVVAGTGAKFSIANYGKIEKVYFEATIRIPNGNQAVYVRLYNASSQQHIVNSDLTLSSGTPTLVTSQAISLTDTKDENLYQVQLKTQLGSPTYIDQARIHIIAR